MPQVPSSSNCLLFSYRKNEVEQEEEILDKLHPALHPAAVAAAAFALLSQLDSLIDLFTVADVQLEPISGMPQKFVFLPRKGFNFLAMNFQTF